MKIIKELCVENCEKIEAGILAGADRLELCDNLAEGGTTVSYGVMKAAIALGKAHNIPVFPIIRPRGGKFDYTLREVSMMIADIKIARDFGAKGVVIGAITADGQIDKVAMKSMLEQRGAMAVTFHMAFDEIQPEYQKEAIDWLVSQGVQRILTHGGEGKTSIFDNIETIKQHEAISDGRISFVLGGGVTYKNTTKLKNLVSSQEFHGTKIVELPK